MPNPIEHQKSNIENSLVSLSPAAAKLFLLLFAYADRSTPIPTIRIPARTLAKSVGISQRWCQHLLRQLRAQGFLHAKKRKYHQPHTLILTLPKPPSPPNLNPDLNPNPPAPSKSAQNPASTPPSSATAQTNRNPTSALLNNIAHPTNQNSTSALLSAPPVSLSPLLPVSPVIMPHTPKAAPAVSRTACYNPPMIYLDNNATTMPDPAVTAAMLPFLSTHYGNPSSTHRFGQEARQAVEQARHHLASLLGCTPAELLLTSGGTESDNAALTGLLAVCHAQRREKSIVSPQTAGMAAEHAVPSRNVIITSAVEHSAIREPLAVLEKTGHEIIRIPVSIDGTLDVPTLQNTLEARAAEIALVTIMWANNETGILFDVPAIGTLCRQFRIPFHVDGVQAVGKIPMRLADLPIDLFSLSAHKFHGPKGTGALYVRRGTRWQPFLRGGPQERDRRGGTENVPGIVGMGVAAQLAQTALADATTTARITQLRDHLETQLLAAIPDTHIIGNPAHRVPNTTNLAFAGLEAEAILLLLSEQDICASAGAACSSGSLEPSPVLRAMNIPDPIAHGAVRFSLSRFTTAKEIDQAVRTLPSLIARLRQTLPV